MKDNVPMPRAFVIEDDPLSGSRMLGFALCMMAQAAIWFTLGFFCGRML